jgi:hypothetical protein
MSPGLSRLETLALVGQIGTLGDQLSDEGILLLANSPHLVNLGWLHLSGVRLHASGLEAILASPALHRLVRLDLPHNVLGFEGAALLARSPRLAGLTHLGLAAHPIVGYEIDDAGAAALAGSPHLTGLRYLDLSCNQIGDAGACALASSPHLAGLRILNLDVNTTLTADGVLALIRSPSLPNLVSLALDPDLVLPDEVQEAYQARFPGSDASWPSGQDADWE